MYCRRLNDNKMCVFFFEAWQELTGIFGVSLHITFKPYVPIIALESKANIFRVFCYDVPVTFLDHHNINLCFIHYFSENI